MNFWEPFWVYTLGETLVGAAVLWIPYWVGSKLVDRSRRRWERKNGTTPGLPFR